MMICSLLLFLGLFDSSEAAIDHYNKVRAINGKALTICSQKRYVHFFEGFLKYKLQEATTDNAKLTIDKSTLPAGSYFEQSLKRYNFLKHNRVWEDMSNE